MEACTEILSSWKRLTDRAIADGRYQAAIRDTAGGICVESVSENSTSAESPRISCAYTSKDAVAVVAAAEM
jgi:hypothetical protein